MLEWILADSAVLVALAGRPILVLAVLEESELPILAGLVETGFLFPSLAALALADLDSADLVEFVALAVPILADFVVQAIGPIHFR